ncbi:MAG TPA: hypothetical protein VJ742_05615 [Nitrososphaera sp.]|nr:hypothetical protein [Nitrososphaera sp.]
MPVIKTYIQGNPTVVQADNLGGCVEVVLNDGRTAQMYFTEDGKLSVRAWGNIPASLGNSNKTSFRCVVYPETKTHCAICFSKLNECSHI